MGLQDDLPGNVIDLIRSASSAEFATVTATGTPLDTPLLCFPAEDLSTIDMATGLAYPAKAERVRRNPKVGLLIEGVRPGEPVISIAGMAAARDADIQSNTVRYLSETDLLTNTDFPWEVRRKAIWYWPRIIIAIVPKQVLWWDNPDALDGEPHRWDAPADTTFPSSDPAPSGPGVKAPKWREAPWRDLAKAAFDRAAVAHLSLMDRDGFPRIIRVRNARATDRGLAFDIPAGAPGRREGPASLTFAGRETFIGQLADDGAAAQLVVERTLPILPMMDNPNTAWNPAPEIRDALMGRLMAELARRNQPLPTIPEAQPTPTQGALRRQVREAGLVWDASSFRRL